MIVLHLLTILLFVYLLATLSYLFVLSVAGRFGRFPKYSACPQKARIAVIIPSYKEDNIILNTATQALLQHYPRTNYTVTVIADQLQPGTIRQLKEIPVRVIEVKWEKSMKAKSLNVAFQQLAGDQGEGAGKGYDLAFILDADNIMSPDCLEKVNHAWQQGWEVIQCHRTAKNKNNSVAILDAMSEEMNNTIFRRGQRALGLSCALIGSGMAFRYSLIKDIFSSPEIQDNPGEDKVVEMQLISRGVRVEYLEDAYVYDEKVQRKEVFEKQRTRWLGTQIDNLRPLLAKKMRENAIGRIYYLKVLEWLLLPRLLLLALFGLLLLLSAADIFMGLHLLAPAWPWWIGLMALYGLTLLIAIPASFYNGQTVKAFLKIPVLMLAMLKALMGVKKNKSGFIHTPKEFSN
ncbi:MAG TPA: glycosyltransferase [Puia sp.]|jgi:cellulose synthase/poly-beta-1,6-N-acetylglucosamine synthase-like glycosyltransferase|nr:glycosyltransferase [Puia sp.]